MDSKPECFVIQALDKRDDCIRLMSGSKNQDQDCPSIGLGLALLNTNNFIY